MAAEGAKAPKRSIPTAYISGILTLVALAIYVMVESGCRNPCFMGVVLWP